MDLNIYSNHEITSQIELFWEQVRAPLLVPFLKIMVILCLAMSLMLFVEKVYMGIVIVFIKILRQKPEKKYKWEPIKNDLELANYSYPMVLVQIPMYNEREVIIQILDAPSVLSFFASRDSNYVNYDQRFIYFFYYKNSS